MQQMAIDAQEATAEACIRWLAAEENPDGSLANPWASEKCPCLNRAASPCGGCYRVGQVREHGPGCKVCDGSGRVPKALGLEEVVQFLLDTHMDVEFVNNKTGKRYTCMVDVDGYVCPCGCDSWLHASGETPMLAALRAIVVSRQG